MSDQPPPWNPEAAAALVGKTVVVGLKYKSKDGQVTREEQMHGTITAVDESKGVTLALGGSRSGETYSLPPATDPFHAAPPGAYRIAGDRVVDPDLVALWDVEEEAQ